MGWILFLMLWPLFIYWFTTTIETKMARVVKEVKPWV